MRSKRKISDTVSTTANGQGTVDVKKLFSKPEFRAMLEAMRKKVVYVKP